MDAGTYIPFEDSSRGDRPLRKFLEDWCDFLFFQLLDPVRLIELYEIYQGVNHRLQLLGLAADYFKGFFCFFRRVIKSFAHGFCVTLDYGNRGTQIMADSHDEFCAPLFVVFKGKPHLVQVFCKGSDFIVGLRVFLVVQFDIQFAACDTLCVFAEGCDGAGNCLGDGYDEDDTEKLKNHDEGKKGHEHFREPVFFMLGFPAGTADEKDVVFVFQRRGCELVKITVAAFVHVLEHVVLVYMSLPGEFRHRREKDVSVVCQKYEFHIGRKSVKQLLEYFKIPAGEGKLFHGANLLVAVKEHSLRAGEKMVQGKGNCRQNRNEDNSD